MKKKFILIILCCFLSILLSGCGDGDNQPFSKLSSDKQKSYVWVMAQDVVSSRLKSPKTAKYPNSNEISVKSVGDHEFEVNGYVDAQNSFGATVKTDFSLKLKIDEGFNKESGDYHYQASEIKIGYN